MAIAIDVTTDTELSFFFLYAKFENSANRMHKKLIDIATWEKCYTYGIFRNSQYLYTT